MEPREDTSGRCPRCAARVAGEANFCTVCGKRLRSARPLRATTVEPRPSEPPALVACPRCGAVNAASRPRCGRCGRDPAAPLGVDEEVDERPAASHEGRPAALLLVTLLAGLAMVGVLFTILSARGIGPFAGPVDARHEPAPDVLDVVWTRASSTVSPSGEAPNLVDDDPTTAWQAATGRGRQPWVELGLASPSPVGRLLVWNGHQHGDAYAEHGRAARLRLEIGQRSFVADVVDVSGPQAIDLPEPVTASRVRLTVVRTRPGARYADVAISGVQLLRPVAETDHVRARR